MTSARADESVNSTIPVFLPLNDYLPLISLTHRNLGDERSVLLGHRARHREQRWMISFLAGICSSVDEPFLMPLVTRK